MQLSFFVAGTPVPKGSFRGFNNNGKVVVTNNNPKTKDWELRIAHEAQANIGDWPPCYEGAVQVSAFFGFERPKSVKKTALHTKRPDVDKLLRACLDGITGVLIKDDSQVVDLRNCGKYYVDEGEPAGLKFFIQTP